MHQLYRDYTWINGVPRGRGKANSEGSYFKVVDDAFGKRYSIERYKDGAFVCVEYDSFLLDFRLLYQKEPLRWRRVEQRDGAILLYDSYERAVLVERYHEEGGVCRYCEILSIHGLVVGRQQMFYESLGDSFSGAVLYDRLGAAVMYKKYAAEGELFTELLEEEWDMSRRKAPASLSSTI